MQVFPAILPGFIKRIEVPDGCSLSEIHNYFPEDKQEWAKRQIRTKQIKINGEIVKYEDIASKPLKDGDKFLVIVKQPAEDSKYK